MAQEVADGKCRYWDWTLDVDAWAGSPLFDAIDGFGGNGM